MHRDHRLSRFAGVMTAVGLSAFVLNPLLAQEGQPPEAPELTPQQQAAIGKLMSVHWEQGPTVGKIGDMAEISVPAGYKFTGAAGTQAFLEAYGNPHNPRLLASIVPTDENEDWTLIFQFDDIGYVKDDDKDSINADAILQSFKDGIPESNRQRRAIGGEEIRDISWLEKPYYDPQTNNLTWAMRLHFDRGDAANHDIRILGRRGVMEVTLLGDPNTYSAALPKVKSMLGGYQFVGGHKYSEWKSGDKIAAYGLGGLVAGGAIAVAAKTGLLAKLGVLLLKGGKAVVLGVVALFMAIGAVVKRIFSGRASSTN